MAFGNAKEVETEPLMEFARFTCNFFEKIIRNGGMIAMNKNKLPRTVTKNQAIAYAVVALHTLKLSPNEITEIELANEIPAIMKLHKPDKIIARANKILKGEL